MLKYKFEEVLDSRLGDHAKGFWSNTTTMIS